MLKSFMYVSFSGNQAFKCTQSTLLGLGYQPLDR